MYLLHWSMGVAVCFVWYAYDGGPIWGGLWNSRHRRNCGCQVLCCETYRMAGRGHTHLAMLCEQNQRNLDMPTLPSRRLFGRGPVLDSPNTTAVFTVPSQYTGYLDLAGTVHKIGGSTITVGDEPILLETRNSSLRPAKSAFEELPCVGSSFAPISESQVAEWSRAVTYPANP